ncbi:hypothetical protein LUD75_11340 [Epilithonimonas sp. JDS]|nr:hypothetical protein [Epilithonimonas sp. JDS]
MLKNSKTIIYIIVGFILGILLTILFKKYSSFTFDQTISFEINPFEVFAILINCLLALYISSTLGKKIENERSQKHLIISMLDEFRKEFVLKINNFINNEDFENEVVRFEFKNFRQKNHQNMLLIEQLKLIKTDDADIDVPRDKINKLWELFTNAPESENNVNRLDRLQKIYSLRSDFDRAMILIIFKINSEN